MNTRLPAQALARDLRRRSACQVQVGARSMAAMRFCRDVAAAFTRATGDIGYAVARALEALADCPRLPGGADPEVAATPSKPWRTLPYAVPRGTRTLTTGGSTLSPHPGLLSSGRLHAACDDDSRRPRGAAHTSEGDPGKGGESMSTAFGTAQPLDDGIAPVNRFAVTIYPNDPGRPQTRTVEILRASQYHRCRRIQASAVIDDDQTVSVTGFSFRGYDDALAMARWHARQLAKRTA